MGLIFEIILFNDCIDFLEIAPLLFVNKEIYNTTNDYIQLHCSNYFQKKTLQEGSFVDKISNKKIELCTTCSKRYTKRLNPFHKVPLCKKCTNKKIIHKTNAKQIYKLKNSDLERLPYHCYHLSHYRLGYIYDLHTIQYISLLYKIEKSKKEYKNPPKPSPKSLRRDRVYDIILQQNIQDGDEQYHILSCQPIFYYIQNGSYGIKRVRRTIQEWKEFYHFMHKDIRANTIIHDLNINDYFEKFIQNKDYTIRLIHEKYDLKMIRKEREEIITNELKEYGILDDYKCDAYYNFIINPHENLEECMYTIREHHFFIAHTDYVNIRKNKIDSLHTRRYMSPEQVEEMLQEIEHSAKKIAILFVDNRDNIPDFIKLKYLNRL